jgi:hypothetical protein
VRLQLLQENIAGDFEDDVRRELVWKSELCCRDSASEKKAIGVDATAVVPSTVPLARRSS